jgi:hypothetical protein
VIRGQLNSVSVNHFFDALKYRSLALNKVYAVKHQVTSCQLRNGNQSTIGHDERIPGYAANVAQTYLVLDLLDRVVLVRPSNEREYLRRGTHYTFDFDKPWSRLVKPAERIQKKQKVFAANLRQQLAKRRVTRRLLSHFLAVPKVVGLLLRDSLIEVAVFTHAYPMLLCANFAPLVL